MIINNWLNGGDFQWSGLRTVDCKIGAKRSIHRLAKAFDIKCKIPAEEMRQEILKNQDHDAFQYINRIEADVSWLHVDRARTENRIAVFKG
jgi:hypothetical protein